MSTDWTPRAASLLAIVSDVGNSGAVRALADKIRNDLTVDGKAFDTAFGRLGLATVITESTAHVTWRTSTMPASLEDLDAIAAGVDGGPATVIGSDLDEAKATILARLAAAASGGSSGEVALIERTLALAETIIPAEPPFYRSEFYTRPSTLGLRFGTKATHGELEELVVARVAEADAFLAVAS